VAQGLDREHYIAFRAAIIDHILATDMAHHFDLLAKFRVRAASEEFESSGDSQNRRLLCNALMKAADLSHSALPWDLHEAWSLCVAREFFAQGDEEDRLGMPISPLCDRREGIAGLGKSQQGFITLICLPLYTELAKVAREDLEGVCLLHLERNMEAWGAWEPTKAAEEAVQGEEVEDASGGLSDTDMLYRAKSRSSLSLS